MKTIDEQIAQIRARVEHPTYGQTDRPAVEVCTDIGVAYDIIGAARNDVRTLLMLVHGLEMERDRLVREYASLDRYCDDLEADFSERHAASGGAR